MPRASSLDTDHTLVVIPRRRRGGFALLITITLLAFLVLLLVSLAALTRVETQVASNNQHIAQARQNALFALNIALGQLQKSAGPDQRVTARAEVDPAAAPTNRRWTGVWNSDPASATYGQRLSWLVSGTTPNAAAAVADPGSTGVSTTAVRLVGAQSADLSDAAASDANRVDVSTQEIRTDSAPGLGTTPGGHLVGRYGWWVGDEGLKARANLTNPLRAPWFTPAGSKLAPDRADQLNDIGLAQRNAIEWMRATTTGSDLLEPLLPAVTQPGFGSWLTRDQLPLASANPAATTALTAATRARFHDLTFWSAGVQADVRRGGLKRDLTAAFELEDAAFQASALANAASATDRMAMAGDPAKFISFIYNQSITPSGTYRGPSWHLLRNHYRLYKEVTNLGTLPSFRARTHLPNYRQSLSHSYLDLYNRSATGDPKIADTITKDGVTQTTPRPASPALLPVLNRITFVFGLQTVPVTAPSGADPAATIYEVRLVVTPFIVLHNPYNARLELHDFDGDNYWARIEPRGLPFGQLVRANRNSTDYFFSRRGNVASPMHDRTVALGAAAKNANPGMGYQSFPSIYIPSMTLEPGEVRVFSPEGTAPIDITASNRLLVSGNKNVQGGYYFDRLNGVQYDFWGTMAPLDWPIGPAGATVANTNDYRILVTGDTQLSLAVSALTYTGANNNLILRYYPETSSGDRTGTIGGTNIALHSEFYVKPPGQGGGNSDIAQRAYTAYSSWTDAGAFNGGEPASAYDGEPRPLFAYDIYVKPADHSASSGTSPFPRVSRPFVTTNPLAIVTDTGALGDYPSEASRRGYPSAIAAWQPQHRRLNGSWTTDVLDADPSGTAYWGPSVEAATGLSHVSLLEVPVRPLTSLAQFQHLMISLYGHEPYLAIGNSEASPYVPLTQASARNVSSSVTNPWYFGDTSYLANEALWDSSFFSTLTPGFNGTAYYTGTDATNADSRESVRDAWLAGTRPLLNTRVQPYRSPAVTDAVRQTALLDPVRSAAHLLMDGAFNINSRSIDAWVAVLAGARDAAVPRTDGTTTPVTNAVAIPRTQLSAGDERTSSASDAWNGFTRLTDTQIRTLATQLVSQITQRQAANNNRPFLSLAEFINRALASTALGQRGALQAAIDASGINSAITGIAVDATTQVDFPFPGNGLGNSASAASGHLLQADLLQQIGPFLSARSDTFTIRTYGEALNPVTGTSEGRAWCEAVVQRVPDFVGGEPAETTLAALTPGSASALFGRRFKVTSFRWLSPADL